MGGEAGECGDSEGEIAGVDVVEGEVSLRVGLGLSYKIARGSFEAHRGSGDCGSSGIKDGAADRHQILRERAVGKTEQQKSH